MILNKDLRCLILKCIIYNNTEEFLKDTLDILLENEAQNNLIIANAVKGKELDVSDYFIASVKDDNGAVLLCGICTPPFNIVIYETRNILNEAAVKLLVNTIISHK